MLIGAHQHPAVGVDAEERRPEPALVDDVPSDEQAIERYPTGGGRLANVAVLVARDVAEARVNSARKRKGARVRTLS